MLLSLDLEIAEGVTPAIDAAEMERVCELVLREEQVGRPCLCSLSVVEDERMRAVNARFRGVDAPTDVISLECERPDDPDLAPGEPCELGDLFLAPEYLGRQAASFGTTPADETRLMLIHGLLHLLGYDHIEEADAQAMETREDELLALASPGSAGRHVALTRHGGGDRR